MLTSAFLMVIRMLSMQALVRNEFTHTFALFKLGCGKLSGKLPQDQTSFP